LEVEVKGQIQGSKLDKKKLEQYEKSSETSLKYFGGNLNKSREVNVSKWKESVQKYPWLLSANLNPISFLLRIK
jgi:hypothetical protein